MVPTADAVAVGLLVSHLLVCKHQQHGVSELVFGEHSGQLLPRLVHPLPVVAVDHKDEPWVQRHSSSVTRRPSPSVFLILEEGSIGSEGRVQEGLNWTR